MLKAEERPVTAGTQTQEKDINNCGTPEINGCQQP
jgi:hypothetical protein